MSIFEIILLGIALAMDAATVAMADGINEPKIKVYKIIFLGLLYGFFQGFMPLIGYLSGTVFTSFFVRFTPLLALVLLIYIGLGMLITGVKEKKIKDEKKVSFKVVVVQAFATSIDALAIGLIFIGNSFFSVLVNVSIIGFVTFVITIASIFIGRKFGTILENKAQIIGGIILIIMGIKIFIESI